MSTGNSKESDLEGAAGYAFSQVAGAIVGGMLLCAVINMGLMTFFGTEMSLGGAAIITLFCIPIAWVVRAVVLRVLGR